MIHRIRAFASLSGPERWELVRAAWWLLFVDLGLRLIGLARLQTWLLSQREVGSRSLGGQGGTGALASAERTVRLVTMMARHHLYPMRCLTRALAAQRMLAARGIWLDLRIGVCKEGGRLQAHAWLESVGRPVGEFVDVGQVFEPLLSPRELGARSSDLPRGL